MQAKAYTYTHHPHTHTHMYCGHTPGSADREVKRRGSKHERVRAILKQLEPASIRVSIEEGPNRESGMERVRNNFTYTSYNNDDR